MGATQIPSIRCQHYQPTETAVLLLLGLPQLLLSHPPVPVSLDQLWREVTARTRHTPTLVTIWSDPHHSARQRPACGLTSSMLMQAQ